TLVTLVLYRVILMFFFEDTATTVIYTLSLHDALPILMRDLGATVVCCTPTYALRLAEVAREQNFDLRSIPVRALIHAGEPGANVAQTKARIEVAWHAKCFDHAGASEVGAHSFECELQPKGIHVIESEFIPEV